MRVAVVGLGHIGLALAVQYASRGHTVIGCDIDTAVVEALNAGRAPHDDEPEVVERVPQLVAAGVSRPRSTTRGRPRGRSGGRDRAGGASTSERQVDFTADRRRNGRDRRGIRPGHARHLRDDAARWARPANGWRPSWRGTAA